MQEDSAERRARMAEILSDPDQVFEAMGPDGIKYDFNTVMLRMNEDQRKMVSFRMSEIDRRVAANLAAAIVDRNYAALGALICGQVERYFETDINSAH